MSSISFRLRQRLSNSIKRQLTKAGIAPSSACDHMLAKLITTGVERMVRAGVAEHEDKLRLAEHNLRRLANQLTEQANNLKTFPVVDDKGFNAAVKTVCPIWPFC